MQMDPELVMSKASCPLQMPQTVMGRREPQLHLHLHLHAWATRALVCQALKLRWNELCNPMISCQFKCAVRDVKCSFFCFFFARIPGKQLKEILGAAIHRVAIHLDKGIQMWGTVACTHKYTQTQTDMQKTQRKADSLTPIGNRAHTSDFYSLQLSCKSIQGSFVPTLPHIEYLHTTNGNRNTVTHIVRFFSCSSSMYLNTQFRS